MSMTQDELERRFLEVLSQFLDEGMTLVDLDTILTKIGDKSAANRMSMTEQSLRKDGLIEVFPISGDKYFAISRAGQRSVDRDYSDKTREDPVLSEHARQLLQSIIEKGYVTPENSWEGFSILNLLEVTNGKSYQWLGELEQSGHIKRMPSPKFQQDDSFYAIAPLGYISGYSPGILTTINLKEHRDYFESKMDTKSFVGEKSLNQKGSIETFAKQKQISWSGWFGALATIVGIFVALWIAGKF